VEYATVKSTIMLSILFLFTACGAGSDEISANATSNQNPNTSSNQASNVTSVQQVLSYQGAFRLNGLPQGDSKLNNSEAIFDINPLNNSLFITSRTGAVSCIPGTPSSHSQSITEVQIPQIVNSINLADLNEATVIQPFKNMLDFANIPLISTDPYTANIDCMDRITGIKYLQGQLILNTMEYYDGQNNNIDTTLIVNNASDLANSPLSGFFQIQGAAHLTRWISEIPLEWETLLGGTHVFGNGNNYPRNGRQSYGPSAFSVDMNQITPAKFNQGVTAVASIPMIDYEVSGISEYYGYGGTGQYIGALHPDFFNINGQNKLWTEKSKAVFGFIVPNTSTYLVLGSSGGHNSRICYKNTYSKTLKDFQTGKRTVMDEGCASIRTPAEIAALPPAQQVGIQSCGGYCIVDPKDLYNFYWMYDVNDMVKVKQGLLSISMLKPYASGTFEVPFQQDINGNPEFHPIASAALDKDKNLLYISLKKAGTNGLGTQNNNRPPVMLVYKLLPQ
jgi:hypothetical protein